MSHPYTTMPSYTRWRSVSALDDAGDLDPVISLPFRIGPDDKVATAGSCFAQHIARHLRLNNFKYFVAENAPDVFDADLRMAFNYGVFSARFGNIYTTRQLVQLFKRAFGEFTPQEKVWSGKGGQLIDPFRPTIQPDGFSSLDELEFDRRYHLASVRRMFAELDVMVFTLGLTETWMSRVDGAALPICPGVAGGAFNPIEHTFHNLTVAEIVQDLREFFTLLFSLNRRAKVILTVSPVPLAATAENQHVLVSNTYSKAALRVACEEVVRDYKEVCYFPSFEVITGNYNRGIYYDRDLRTVTEDGVSHVMRLFFRHVTTSASIQPLQTPNLSYPEASPSVTSKQLNKILCDEELLMHL